MRSGVQPVPVEECRGTGRDLDLPLNARGCQAAINVPSLVRSMAGHRDAGSPDLLAGTSEAKY
jgi:hypothetical protein